MLKDKLVSSFYAFEEEVDVNLPVHSLRMEAFKEFQKKGFPTKKDEAWKYTSLSKLLKEDYSIFPKKERNIEYNEVKDYMVYDIDSYLVVFVNGRYSSHLSKTTHEKIDVCLLSSVLSKKQYKEVVKTYFGKAIDTNNSLNYLNTAFAREGAFIQIPDNIVVDKPIQILNFCTEDALLLQPRNLIVVGKNAQVQIIERHQSLGELSVFTNVVTEIFADENANVDYYKIQNDKITVSLIDNTYIKQQQHSNCEVHTFSLGGRLTRNNLNFFQQGKLINSTLNGLTLIEGKQHVDHNTLVHHTDENCTSHQEYKGIFDDSSTGVFNGKVYVEKVAQYLNAYQSNKNLLISDKATINAKPQLEIFADDVRCSHGCTIGQLDEEALFYLKSRGIPHKEAQALLMYAFANNVLEGVKILELKKRINRQIAQKLGVDLSLHI